MKRSTNIVFVIFRLMLSLVMFAVLLGGIYSAYKHFSGLDPLKIDPKTILSQSFVSKIIPKDEPVISNPKSPKMLFSFLLIADSHSDNVNFKKALTEAMPKNPQFIIGLGDYSDVGTVGELNNAKKELDSSGLRYFLVAGDHDLWDSRNTGQDPQTNFKQVFGLIYQSFTYKNFRFLLLDNSDNYKGFGQDQSKWITSELDKAAEEKQGGIFVFLHEPLFHPSSDHYMGRVEKDLKSQAQGLIFELKKAEVKKIFAGDIHYFSEYNEPVTQIPMVTVGAITSERNPQAPRYTVVTVFDDGSTKVDDVEIK